jgi:hypothetical protein
VIDRHITLAAARLVISGEHGDPLKQSGFAGTVFADNDGDLAIEAQFEIVLEKWQAERISLAIGDARGIEPQPLQIWRRQIDVAISS